MSTARDPNAVIAAWIDEGPTELPESSRRAIVTATRTITQRRRDFGRPWRFPTMNGFSRFALVSAAVVVAAAGGIYLLNPTGPQGQIGGPAATATPGPSPSPSPTRAPSPSPSRATVGTVTFDGSDCTFEPGPDSLVAGPTWFITVNNSADRAGFDLWRMRDDHRFEELVAWIDEEQRRLEAGLPVVGYPLHLAHGPANIEHDAGSSGRLADLTAPGTHGIVCYRDVDDDEGQGTVRLTAPFEIR